MFFSSLSRKSLTMSRSFVMPRLLHNKSSSCLFMISGRKRPTASFCCFGMNPISATFLTTRVGFMRSAKTGGTIRNKGGQRKGIAATTQICRRFASNRKNSDGEPPGRNRLSTWWKKWAAPRTMPPRQTPQWYGEMALLCTVFAITGSSTMFLVRPAVKNILGLEGSFKDGPWSYRICTLVIMTPMYAMLLVVVGTAFGRHAYFRHFAVKMFSRFGIPPELMDKTFHETKSTFRKW